MNAVLAIAARDVTKFLRDPSRLIVALIFPALFVGVLGGSFRTSIAMGFDPLTFIFTGVYAQTLFQSAALGVVSLLEDREHDFTQELFVSPVSRYAIVAGKIVGESLVALIQGCAVIVFGLVIGVSLPVLMIGALLVVGLVVCLCGGAFGLLVLGNISSQRTANQIFPLIFFPQFILAGVFNPIKHLPWFLAFLSAITPLRYGVDLTRNVYYAGTQAFARATAESPLVNLAVIAGLFVVCLILGTLLFVRSERNR